MTQAREFHPVAEIFPLMGEAEIAQLADDICENGLREPIWLHSDGRIIDGRNRYKACALAVSDPTYRTYDGDDVGLVAFVVSLNLHRRHLSESQRAMVASKIASLPPHRPEGGKFAGIPTQAEAADMLSVSERSVRSATKVRDDGAPELVAAVESGKVAVSTGAMLADAPAEEQRAILGQLKESEIIAAARGIHARKAEARRADRIDRLVEISRGNQPLHFDRRYSVILADPPWRYENPPMGASSRSIENHYPTMTLEEICALPVATECAADDAVLFLWATAPKLAECMQVIAAWGFVYRTCATWVKDKIGMGYHFRNQHELLLVAKRGEVPPPPPSVRVSSVFHGPRLDHSEKPERAYEIIEAMYPELARVELFQRAPRVGWPGWGNQARAA